MRLFGTDGIRGVVNEDLTPDLAFRLGNAIGRLYKADILIAKDTRKSGDMIESALASGIASSGSNAILCGILPTPALALLSSKMRTVGVVISASHNPPKFNGIKILKNGFKIPDSEEEKIESMIESVELSDYRSVGSVERFERAIDVYVGEILQMFDDLDLSGMEIDVDVANGASYRTTPLVLEKLGADVEVFSNTPDGFNINQGCGSTNIDFLRSRKRDGSVGIAHDGDADRCIMLDEDGEEVHGDKIMGIMAVQMMDEKRLKNGRVVATIMSNLGLEEFLKSHGIVLERTKVGDRYVLERMLETGTTLGGERSGHVIFLDRSTTGDGLITALEVLRAMRKSSKFLSDLHSEIPEYPQVLINVEVSDKGVVNDPRILKLVESISEPGYRIIVRPSGTEPVVRIMVEGKDIEVARSKAGEIAQLVGEIDGGFKEDSE